MLMYLDPSSPLYIDNFSFTTVDTEEKDGLTYSMEKSYSIWVLVMKSLASSTEQTPIQHRSSTMENDIRICIPCRRM